MFNIAIVDDTMQDREWLKALLDSYRESKGVDLAVFCFDNAANFFDKYHAQFGLIFMDIEMPSGENGLEIAKRLLRDNPDLKLIFASSSSSPQASFATQSMDTRRTRFPF